MTAPRSVGPTVTSQAVLAPLTDAAIFLVATVREGGEETVRELLEDLSGLQRSVGFRVPAAQLSCVTGIGSDLWDRLFAGPRPAGLHRFRQWKGPVHTAPATPGDLLFHLRAGQVDVCFEMATKIVQRLAGAADVVDETHGFKYFDERDLLGFVDGTENPTGVTAERAVLVGEEDPGFAGGSYVLVQKYVHDMAAWNALTVEQQEAVIGRTKLDNIELAEKPANSHVRLNVVEDHEGNELKILRDNMPFGSPGSGEFGTYYIAYAASPDVPELMLRRMFLGEPYGTYDRILDFSTPLTGSLFFAPTGDFLDDLPGPPAQA
ncbi:peroxidase [Actinoplanes sp. NBRC 14428]|uniref:Putative iron-dependent peroxidase n=1 Tax=Pseudosporangium ferrugineum TaxID=439699 RepID=A0A2T0S8A2_9ACTN|nr:Dyp-type peroxidase [Pseudosporangium ferrugineum]PRY29646.1 putative iron-dependent peroxidase [Pseudosporangium ferrugineum]BCJ52599.1 peroxidase [Actinoplanes sp. NBRC 14428]